MDTSSGPSVIPQTVHQSYLPRFLARGFAIQAKQQMFENEFTQTESQQSKNFYLLQKASLHAIRLTDGVRIKTQVSDCRELLHMCQDVAAPSLTKLQRELCHFEDLLDDIFRLIHWTFRQHRPGLMLDHMQRDTLMKFIFFVRYRNSFWFARLDFDSIGEYKGNDKKALRRYMQKRGLRSPRDVWLSNVSEFLDVESNEDSEWPRSILQKVYLDDGHFFLGFMSHMEFFFCKPSSGSDEFILPDNVCSVLEGYEALPRQPALEVINKESFSEWHYFLPILPKLLIIVRNIRLPWSPYDMTSSQDVASEQTFEKLNDLFPTSSQHETSAFRDLPIQRLSHYHLDRPTPLVQGKAVRSGEKSRHHYHFDRIDLDTSQINRINAFLLGKAVSAGIVIFKSDLAMSGAIKSYLESHSFGPKVTADSVSAVSRFNDALQSALQAFGSTACVIPRELNTIREPNDKLQALYERHAARFVAQKTVAIIADNYPLVYGRYCQLRSGEADPQHTPNVDRSKDSVLADIEFIHDADSAGKVAFMESMIEQELLVCRQKRNKPFKSASDEIRILRARRHVQETAREARFTSYNTLRPCIAYLFVKIFRNSTLR